MCSVYGLSAARYAGTATSPTAVAGSLGLYSCVETSRAVAVFKKVCSLDFKPCACTLTDSIVAELYSEEKMNLMVDLDNEALMELLQDKMKST